MLNPWSSQVSLNFTRRHTPDLLIVELPLDLAEVLLLLVMPEFLEYPKCQIAIYLNWMLTCWQLWNTCYYSSSVFHGNTIFLKLAGENSQIPKSKNLKFQKITLESYEIWSKFKFWKCLQFFHWSNFKRLGWYSDQGRFNITLICEFSNSKSI